MKLNSTIFLNKNNIIFISQTGVKCMLYNIWKLRHYIVGQAFMMMIIFYLVDHFTSLQFWKYPMENTMTLFGFCAFIVNCLIFMYLNTELETEGVSFIGSMTKVYGLILLAFSYCLAHVSEYVFGIKYNMLEFLLIAWIISAPIVFLKMCLWYIEFCLAFLGISFVNYKFMEETIEKDRQGRLSTLEAIYRLKLLDSFNEDNPLPEPPDIGYNDYKVTPEMLHLSNEAKKQTVANLNNKWGKRAWIPVILMCLYISIPHCIDVGKWIYTQYQAENRIPVFSLSNYNEKNSNWVFVNQMDNKPDEKVFYDKNTVFIDDTKGIINTVWKYVYSDGENVLYSTTFKIGAAQYITTDIINCGKREISKDFFKIEEMKQNTVISNVYKKALTDHGTSPANRKKTNLVEYIKAQYCTNNQSRFQSSDDFKRLAYDYTPFTNETGRIIGIEYYSLEDRKNINVDIIGEGSLKVQNGYIFKNTVRTHILDDNRKPKKDLVEIKRGTHLKFIQQIGNKYYFNYSQDGKKGEIVTSIENLQKSSLSTILKISFKDKIGKTVIGYVPREYLTI